VTSHSLFVYNGVAKLHHFTYLFYKVFAKITSYYLPVFNGVAKMTSYNLPDFNGVAKMTSFSKESNSLTAFKCFSAFSTIQLVLKKW
jgi:hypothetical protein